jgi:hypothetical protein
LGLGLMRKTVAHPKREFSQQQNFIHITSVERFLG